MKYIKFLILMFCSFLIFNTSVGAAASNFDIMVNMAPDITENQINVLIGYTGEEVMAVKETFSYDSSKLTLIDVEALDNFTITLGDEVIDGKWKTIPLVADSDYSFTSTNFAVITFEVNAAFKVNKNADVVFYNIEAAGPKKEKYRDDGYVMTMDRESISEMYFMLKEITDSTSMEFWLSENWVLLVIIGLAVVGVIVLIVMLPTRRKKEQRDTNLNDQLKKENYDSSSTVKIDQSTIDKIGAIEKTIDMSEAIIVDEKVKPFGDIIGRDEIVTNSENLGNINLNNVQNTSVINNLPEANQVIDAFNIKPEEKALQSNQVQENTNQENMQNNAIEALEKPTETQVIENNISNNDNNEGLTVIQPLTFEDVSQQQNDSLNNSGNLFSILFLFILSLSLLTISGISAEEGEYRIEDLRNYLVGNIPYDKSLDYSGDNKVDILDLIYTKNLVNCNFEELVQTDPGFAELHGKSNNLISTSEDWIKTTKAKKTTTKKITTRKKTTTKKETIAKTTTKKTTTAKETTTKATYIVNIVAQNGMAAASSIMVSGSSNTVVITPNTGYEFASVDCGSTAKGSYNRSSNILTVKSVKANSTCNVIFAVKDNIKVSITAKNGKASPSSLTGTYKSSATSTVTPKEGYQYSQVSCSNNINAAYDAATNTFRVIEFTESGSCTITFGAKSYPMTFQDSAGNTLYSTMATYGEEFAGSIETTAIYARVKCNSTTKTLTVADITPSGSTEKHYRYSFKYTVKGDTVCVFN